MNPREIDCWECSECSTHYFEIEEAEQCCMPHDDNLVSQIKGGVVCPVCVRVHKDLDQIIAVRLFEKCLVCSPILSYKQKEQFEQAREDASCW